MLLLHQVHPLLLHQVHPLLPWHGQLVYWTWYIDLQLQPWVCCGVCVLHFICSFRVLLIHGLVTRMSLVLYSTISGSVNCTSIAVSGDSGTVGGLVSGASGTVSGASCIVSGTSGG